MACVVVPLPHHTSSLEEETVCLTVEFYREYFLTFLHSLLYRD